MFSAKKIQTGVITAGYLADIIGDRLKYVVDGNEGIMSICEILCESEKANGSWFNSVESAAESVSANFELFLDYCSLLNEMGTIVKVSWETIESIHNMFMIDLVGTSFNKAVNALGYDYSNRDGVSEELVVEIVDMISKLNLADIF